MENANEKFRRDLSADEIVENKEDITLIWLDENMDDLSNLSEMLNQLHQLNDCILLYTKPQLCLDYIKRVINETIILILSKYLSTTELLNDINSLDIIDSIFIYSNNDGSCDIDFNLYSRKIEVSNDRNSLLKSIETRIHLISKQIKYDLFDNSYLKSVRNLKSKPVSFLWFHLLIDILNILPKTNEAKQQMIDVCRNYYQRNKSQLNIIKHFEDTYQSSDAIRWYTKDSFLHKSINKALRTEDVFALYLFRYYIIDLCERIKHESEIYISSLSKDEIIKLYRGQIVSKKDLEILEKSIGYYISPNGFFSTSEDREVALMFVGNNDQSDGVIFEIKINSSVLKETSMLLMAPIQHLSCFPQEKEVLFGIGTTFKIENIIYDSEVERTCVQMTVTDQDFQYIQEYIRLKRKQLEETNPTSLFGELIIDVGLYSKAELYFQSIIETLPQNHKDLPSLYHDLGYVYYKKGLYDEALKYAIIAHDTLKNTLQPSDMHIAQSSVNLGWTFKKHGDTHLAMKHFQEALHISQTNYSDQDHHTKAMALISIGDTYTDFNDYHKALHYLKQGLMMFKRIVPRRHQEIANTLMKFGNLYEKKSLYNRAIKYYESGYKMALLTMTIEHPRVLEYLKCVLNIYNKTNNIDQFTKVANENLARRREVLGDVHVNIAQIYIIIGDLTNSNEEKLLKYNQALDILEKCLPNDQEAMSICRNKIDAIKNLSN